MQDVPPKSFNFCSPRWTLAKRRRSFWDWVGVEGIYMDAGLERLKVILYMAGETD